MIAASIPGDWAALAELGPENVWRAMVRWDSSELAAKLTPHLTPLASCEIIVEAGKCTSASVRLLALAVLAEHRFLGDIERLKRALGPGCRLSDVDRCLVLRAAEGTLPFERDADWVLQLSVPAP
jgi:hypothetical protein